MGLGRGHDSSRTLQARHLGEVCLELLEECDKAGTALQARQAMSLRGAVLGLEQ